MTTNDALIAEPESIAFDVAPMAAAAATIVSNREPIMRYVAAVRAIPMGEQPVVVGGTVVMRYDILYKKMPQLNSALYEAIGRADKLESAMSSLHHWAAGGAKDWVGTNITPRLEKIRSIVAAVPAGGTVGLADLQTIREQMQYVAAYSMFVKMAMNSITGMMKEFLSQIVKDHDTFAGGPYELGRVHNEIGNQISEEARPYIINPISSGIGEAILQVGRAFLAAIERLGQVLNNALIGHEAMSGAATALSTASSNAWTKYEAAASAVAKADGTTISAVIRKINLDTAIKSWNQFVEFFSKSNL